MNEKRYTYPGTSLKGLKGSKKKKIIKGKNMG